MADGDARENTGADHQFNAIDILDAFCEHDLTALRALDDEGRLAQLVARQALYQHVDTIWEAAKVGEAHPADDMDTYGGVAAFRDIAGNLVSNVQQIQDEVGDPDD